MKKRICLMLTACLMLSACGDKDEPQPQPKKLTLKISADYTVWGGGGKTFPDKGAKAYVFYGADYEAEGYTYVTGGNYAKAGMDTVRHEQNVVMVKVGWMRIEPKYTDRPVLVVVECAYYSGRIAEMYEKVLTMDNNFWATFNPI